MRSPRVSEEQRQRELDHKRASHEARVTAEREEFAAQERELMK